MNPTDDMPDEQIELGVQLLGFLHGVWQREECPESPDVDDLFSILSQYMISEQSHLAVLAEVEAQNKQAIESCKKLYLSLHVSQMADQPEAIKHVWSVGQELYLDSIKQTSEGDV